MKLKVTKDTENNRVTYSGVYTQDLIFLKKNALFKKLSVSSYVLCCVVYYRTTSFVFLILKVAVFWDVVPYNSVDTD
jgi:hypothetical protein